MPSYQYRKSHCGNKTILWSSYLRNGISFTGKMTSLYWIKALVTDSKSTSNFQNLILKLPYNTIQQGWTEHIPPHSCQIFIHWPLGYVYMCNFNSSPPGPTYIHWWTNADLLSNGPLRTNFSENWIKILTFSFKKMNFKMLSAKWQPFFQREIS